MFLKMHQRVSGLILFDYYIVLGCPGTQSKEAGKVSGCQGCPNQSVCASGQPQPPDPGMVGLTVSGPI